MDFIEIDLTPIYQFLDQFSRASALGTMWILFKSGGWLIFLWLSYIISKELWISYRQQKFDEKQTYVLLAVDVPKGNEQTPLAVENIFSHLLGAHSPSNWGAKYWNGSHQQNFSFEIVSLEGNVQFFIRTNTTYRDLVEAAVYAQYPDAEIYEAPDYTEQMKMHFPSDEYDLWGTEWHPQMPECYPLRTYPDFEDSAGDFKDPLSALYENFSRLNKGESAGLQFILTPINQKDWKAAGEKVVSKLIGAPEKHKKTLADHLTDTPLNILQTAGNFFSTGEAVEAKREEKKEPSQILYLTPGQRHIVEAIEKKMNKNGYKVKIRAIYLARKEVFSKNIIAAPLIGIIKQFNTVDLLNLKPDTNKVGTYANYYMVERRKNWRKNKILSAYKGRSSWAGVGPKGGMWGQWGEFGTGAGFVLNTEELATLWHFPAITIKAPLVKKTAAKKIEPPFGLPEGTSQESSLNIPQEQGSRNEPPQDLPIISE